MLTSRRAATFVALSALFFSAIPAVAAPTAPPTESAASIGSAFFKGRPSNAGKGARGKSAMNRGKGAAGNRGGMGVSARPSKGKGAGGPAGVGARGNAGNGNGQSISGRSGNRGSANNSPGVGAPFNAGKTNAPGASVGPSKGRSASNASAVGGRGTEAVNGAASQRGKATASKASRGRAGGGGAGGGGSSRAVIIAGARGPDPVAVEGFVCPAGGDLNLTNDWGFPRSGGRYHQGTDVFADRNTPLVAVVDGLVKFSTNSLGGVVAYLEAPNGTRYYYAHLEAYAPGVDSGSFVAGGTTIGFVGDSGNAKGTPPHVHFQIHPYGGDPVNPYPVLTDACR